MAKNRKKKNTAKKAAEKAAAEQQRTERNKKRALFIGAVVCAVIVCVLLGILLFGPHREKVERYAVIDIADYGRITVELRPDAAPETVANFVKLSKEGFYDGLTFHRIMAGFMMQGGDPEGNGSGGSGTNIKGEFSKNGVNNPIKHTRGVISMARAQAYNSASSQFFIMHADYPSLDGSYAAFGEVIDGMDVVDAVCESARPIDNNGTIPADQQPVIRSITVYMDNPLTAPQG